MTGIDDGFGPSIDPEKLGDAKKTPDMYNENIQVLGGSQFVSIPEYIESGLDREIGAGVNREQLLENDKKYNIADILVDQEVWENQPYTPERLENVNGWYPVDFRSEENILNFQGFIRPVENLGWDVVLKTLDNGELQKGASAQASAGMPEEIGVKSPSLGSATEDYEPERTSYYGFFMPSS